MKNIEIDFEGRNEPCAFFALYAGLKMYSDMKAEQYKGTDKMNIAGAEAYCMLQDLKLSHPNEFEEAKKEYENKFKNLFISGVSKCDMTEREHEGLKIASDFKYCPYCRLEI